MFLFKKNLLNVNVVCRCTAMSSLNPIENGLTSDEDQDAQETLSNPSPPPSETIERVEDLLDKVENYNSVIPDSVTQNILESSGLNNTSPEVFFKSLFQYVVIIHI